MRPRQLGFLGGGKRELVARGILTGERPARDLDAVAAPLALSAVISRLAVREHDLVLTPHPSTYAPDHVVGKERYVRKLDGWQAPRVRRVRVTGRVGGTASRPGATAFALLFVATCFAVVAAFQPLGTTSRLATARVLLGAATRLAARFPPIAAPDPRVAADMPLGVAARLALAAPGAGITAVLGPAAGLVLFAAPRSAAVLVRLAADVVVGAAR